MGAISLAEGICDVVIPFVRVSMIGGCEPFPFFNYTIAFALQLRRIMETLSQGSRLVLDSH
jgi:hypothetical protein